MNIKQQTATQKAWRDEQGLDVPFTRITPLEKKKEKHAFALAQQALKIHETLCTFKLKVDELSTEVFKEVLTEKELKKASKGNFTWYNFDMSIKIEVSIDERIEFDATMIEKCKQKLLELVEASISKDMAFLKELVLGAFQTSRGRLDTKKVLALKKYASRITDRRYTEAMKYLDDSIRRPNSKKYFRVFVREENGEYRAIDLNFSSI